MEHKTITEFKLIDVNKLVPYQNNSRTHTPEQINKIRSSLREFGFVNPIIITDDYGVLAGHGRLAAAKQEGYSGGRKIMLQEQNSKSKERLRLEEQRAKYEQKLREQIKKDERRQREREKSLKLLIGELFTKHLPDYMLYEEAEMERIVAAAM